MLVQRSTSIIKNTKNDYCDYFILASKNIDSDMLEISNFDCIFKALGGYAVHLKLPFYNGGWIEMILISQTASETILTICNKYRNITRQGEAYNGNHYIKLLHRHLDEQWDIYQIEYMEYLHDHLFYNVENWKQFKKKNYKYFKTSFYEMGENWDNGKKIINTLIN